MSVAPTAPLRRPLPPVQETPQGSPCPHCSAPVEPTDAFCPSCGSPLAPTAAPGATLEKKLGFRCEHCGAEIRCDPGSRTTTCPFCAAPYVVEFDPAATGRQDPEFVIGFAVTPDRAEQIYRQWLAAGGLFRPSNLIQQVQAESLRGVYLPFWSFSMKADSRWWAEVGEYWYRTETYTETDAQGRTVTKTRQVRETEWWPLEGGHHAFYSFYLVSGSKGLPQQVSQWIEPFELLALKRYSPRFLAGWMSEEYSVAREAARALSEAEFQRREHASVAAFLPGDTYRAVRVETHFSNVNSDLILLPIYLRSYRYRGKLYRTLINGQTGKVNGEKPVSLVKIALFVVAIVMAGLIVVALVNLLGGSR